MKAQLILVLLAASVFISVNAVCGDAESCPEGEVCDRIGTHTDAACVDPADSGACASGYTDDSTGGVAAVGEDLSGDCGYCLEGYALNAKSASATLCIDVTTPATETCLEGYTDVDDGSVASDDDATALTGDCSNCVTGYTETDDACVAGASLIAYGVMLLAVIFAALF